MPPVKKSKIFISYSRKDTQIADSLARDLTSVGVDVWMDREDIEVGERWSTAIQNALETAQAMVLVLSPDSMSSSNVEDEFTYFLDNNKPIVPIMVRQTRLHFQLHRLQWIDFTGDKPEQAYERLLRALAQVGVEFRTLEKAGEQSRLVSLIDTIYAERRKSRQRRRYMGMAGGVLALLVIVGILVGMMLFTRDEEKENPVGAENIPAQVLNPQEVPVFRQPSRDSSLVSAKSDELVFVKRRTPDNRFVLVTVGNGTKEGWILAENIRLLDDEVNEISEIAIYVSPTPTPSPTPSPFLTPTPTLTPSPTPEVVLNPNPGECLVNVKTPAVARYAPFVTSSGDFGDLFPGESFIATLRRELNWYYIGIGWVNTDTGNFELNDLNLCSSLQISENEPPNRLRPFLRKIDLVQQLLANPGAAPRPLPNTSVNEAEFAVEQAWQNYGVVLQTAAELLNIDEGLLLAVVVDEAINTGSSTGDDLLQIRFEADVFRQLIPKQDEADFFTYFEIDPKDPTIHRFRFDKLEPWLDYHSDPALEWQVFEQARQINEDAALRALRYGTTGLLGSDHLLVGYSTPQEMYEAYLQNQSNRIVGKLDYIKSNPNTLTALRFANWELFAEVYPDTRVGPTLAIQAQTYYQAFLRLSGE